MNIHYYADGVWALVSVTLDKVPGKSRRVNITMPELLLALIDQHAKQHGEIRIKIYCTGSNGVYRQS